MRVLILSNYPLYSQGIEMLLRGESNLEWVGRATELADALAQLGQMTPDVVIVDDSFVSCSAIAQSILQAQLPTRLVKLSVQNNFLCTCAGKPLQSVQDLYQAVTRVTDPGEAERLANISLDHDLPVHAVGAPPTEQGSAASGRDQQPVMSSGGKDE